MTELAAQLRTCQLRRDEAVARPRDQEHVQLYQPQGWDGGRKIWGRGIACCFPEAQAFRLSIHSSIHSTCVGQSSTLCQATCSETDRDSLWASSSLDREATSEEALNTPC